MDSGCCSSIPCATPLPSTPRTCPAFQFSTGATLVVAFITVAREHAHCGHAAVSLLWRRPPRSPSTAPHPPPLSSPAVGQPGAPACVLTRARACPCAAQAPRARRGRPPLPSLRHDDTRDHPYPSAARHPSRPRTAPTASLAVPCTAPAPRPPWTGRWLLKHPPRAQILPHHATPVPLSHFTTSSTPPGGRRRRCRAAAAAEPLQAPPLPEVVDDQFVAVLPLPLSLSLP